MTTLLLLVAGFVLLVAGGDLLVRGAVGVATRLGLSPLLIGITLVGFGTSTPELVTSLQAALTGAPGIAVGNVVGSNIANVLLILGLGAAISPLAADPRAFGRDGPALAAATLALVALTLWGSIGRGAGAVLVAGLAGYLLFAYRMERQQAAPETVTALSGEGPPVWRSVLFFAAGLALTILGARWLVAAAVETAAALGVSETVIGLTIVAVGTSLPELVTTVIAALKRQSDIAFGNVLGSNIYNILGILGTVGLVTPVAIPPEILRLDIWVMAGSTLVLFAVTLTGWRITRGEGVALLIGYAAYLGWLAAAA